MSTSHSIHLRDVLAKNVRRLRHCLEISQETLADKAGLHRTYIGSIERSERNVSIDSLDKIAKALEVEVYILLREEKK